jgi:AcrR family transcriptional regulator
VVKPSGQANVDAKSRILDAADEIFVRRGIDGAPMQEIADHAGVNKALLHYYFRSKAQLAQALWFRIASSFAPGILQMMASDLPLDDKIDRCVDAYHATLTRHPISWHMSSSRPRDIPSSSMASIRLTDAGRRDG